MEEIITIELDKVSHYVNLRAISHVDYVPESEDKRTRATLLLRFWNGESVGNNLVLLGSPATKVWDYLKSKSAIAL